MEDKKEEKNLDQELELFYEQFHIDKEILAFAKETEKELKDRFDRIDKIAEYNQMKVIQAMQKNRVSDAHFTGTTGYGYNDIGRETL